MKFMKLPTLVLALLAIFAIGCSSAPKGTKQTSSSASKNSNFLGIVSVRPNSFQAVEPASARVSTSDIGDRRDFSGTQTSLFWGLISVEDY